MAIMCYQCDSNEDLSCPASVPFDSTINALVDCGAIEAKVPGYFCFKQYQESSGCKLFLIFYISLFFVIFILKNFVLYQWNRCSITARIRFARRERLD